MTEKTVSTSSAPLRSPSHRPEIDRLMTLLNAGQENEALAECETLMAAETDHPAALYGLAALAIRHQVLIPALEALARAHTRDPAEPLYPETLAVLYAMAGNLAQAVYFAKLSASLGFDEIARDLLPPTLPSFARTLQIIREKPYLRKAEAYADARLYLEAIQAYEQHLAFFSDDPPALRGLGRCRLAIGRADGVIDCLSYLESSGSLTAADLSLTAQAHTLLGEIEAGLDCHRRAAALAPDALEIGCARVRDATFDPAQNERSLAAQSRALGASLATEPPPPPRALEDRRVRVGYLLASLSDSRDLESAAVVIGASDPQRFEVYIYGWRTIDDPANALLRGCHDEWRDIRECDPATLAAIIKGDEIDILVDAGGHAAPVHLAALALRPAPWQVSWLGNPGTLGLSQLDAELVEEEGGDPEAVTPGVRRLALPHGLYCYDTAAQPRRETLALGQPATFGADITLAQLHPDLLSAWAKVLTALPGAKLALRDRDFIADEQIDRLVALFNTVGIADRIDVISDSTANFYAQIDVALAPFVSLHPHETAEALRCGVPVVALAGPGRHRRQAAVFLGHAGLDRLIADDPDGYVALAIRLGQSPAEWQAAVDAVAETLSTAAVFDPTAFAAELDAALLEIVGLPA
jgi:tetratricopeptide (TPR) repeat protein